MNKVIEQNFGIQLLERKAQKFDEGFEDAESFTRDRDNLSLTVKSEEDKLLSVMNEIKELENKVNERQDIIDITNDKLQKVMDSSNFDSISPSEEFRKTLDILKANKKEKELSEKLLNVLVANKTVIEKNLIESEEYLKHLNRQIPVNPYREILKRIEGDEKVKERFQNVSRVLEALKMIDGKLEIGIEPDEKNGFKIIAVGINNKEILSEEFKIWKMTSVLNLESTNKIRNIFSNVSKFDIYIEPLIINNHKKAIKNIFIKNPKEHQYCIEDFIRIGTPSILDFDDSEEIRLDEIILEFSEYPYLPFYSSF